MKNKIGITLIKIKVSINGTARILSKPHYLATAFIFSFLIANLIIWSLNLDLARYIINEPTLSLADKLDFFSASIRDIFVTYDSSQAFGIAIFSSLFGINISMFIYVLKNIGLNKIRNQSGASGAGLIFAVISGGCVACGTSLLAPLAATLGATSGAFLRDLSLWLNWMGSILILFSIYQLGQFASKVQAEKVLKSKK